MMESRRVSSRGCVKFVPSVRDLAEEFQGGGVRGSKGSECGCKELVAGGFGRRRPARRRGLQQQARRHLYR